MFGSRRGVMAASSKNNNLYEKNLVACAQARFLHAERYLLTARLRFKYSNTDMPNYQSDSSDGEDGDYTETNVLLGYASKDINADGDTTSYLGGQPVRPLI